MQRYILRRILLMAPTVVGVTFALFMLIRFIPGDVIQQIAGESAVITPEVRADIEHRLGLDQPWYTQYWAWLFDAVRGDFGESLRSGVPVSEELRHRLPVTLELTTLALMVSLLIALPVGILSAVRQDTWMDYVARSIAIGALAVPVFWLATLVIVLPSVWWKVAPPLKYVDLWDDPWRNLQIMLFPYGKFIPVGPAVLLGVGLSGTVMRLTRAQMLEVLRQDYIRTAWAKGLRERTVITRHAMKNALIPVVTVVGLQLPFLIGGAVIIESIFSIPGTGRYLLSAIQGLDYTVVQSVVLIIAVAVVVSNLLVDLTYAYLDPRIRYT
ncbi:MAG TPA: ABC transporter permease [Dehalococcoidia bacterium]|nr:ABC transporter permease [Dehalococcoidia bacterium]